MELATAMVVLYEFNKAEDYFKCSNFKLFKIASTRFLVITGL